MKLFKSFKYRKRKFYIGNEENYNKEHSSSMDEASIKIREVAIVLADKFNEIQNYMNDVNGAMLSSSVATEEVNASTEEVLANVKLLATETEESMQMVKDIRVRANEVGESSNKSFETATALTEQFKTKLQVSIENAKVVESIGELANVISEIAEQINLLSLNASIEAAQNTTELSSNIMEAITQLSGNVTDISDMSDRQDIIVRDLNDVVSKFTLD